MTTLFRLIKCAVDVYDKCPDAPTNIAIYNPTTGNWQFDYIDGITPKHLNKIDDMISLITHLK